MCPSSCGRYSAAGTITCGMTDRPNTGAGPMRSGSFLKGLSGLALLCILAQPAAAQAKPYTLDDVMAFLSGGVGATTILSRTRASCINFKVTESIADRLRGQGASDDLIEGLRSVCYKGSSKEVDVPVTRHTNPPEPRVTRRVVPPPPRVETVFVNR